MGTKRHSYGAGLIGVLVLFLALPGVAQAGSDYSDKSLALRLPPAFIRFLEASASGGETVANRFSSAINPASTNWIRMPGKLGVVVSPYYSHTRFDNGTRIHLTGEPITWTTENWGTIQPVVVQLNAHRAPLNTGPVFEYNVDTLQLQWGKRYGNIGIGGTISYSEAEIKLDVPGMGRVSDSHAESYRFRVGALYEPKEKWLIGIVVEDAFAPSRTNAVVPTPGGPMPVRLKDTLYHYIIRPGVSYEYGDLSTVYFDYQYSQFWDDSGHLHHHRFTAGVEHRVTLWLFARLAVAADMAGNVSYSVGATINFAKWGAIDLGYKYDPFPEIRLEFGRSHYFQFTLALRF